MVLKAFISLVFIFVTLKTLPNTPKPTAVSNLTIKTKKEIRIHFKQSHIVFPIFKVICRYFHNKIQPIFKILVVDF
jgi:hypothetical protein